MVAEDPDSTGSAVRLAVVGEWCCILTGEQTNVVHSLVG